MEVSHPPIPVDPHCLVAPQFQSNDFNRLGEKMTEPSVQVDRWMVLKKHIGEFAGLQRMHWAVLIGAMVLSGCFAQTEQMRFERLLDTSGPFTGITTAVPGMIQAEDVDQDNEGVTCHGHSLGTSGNVYQIGTAKPVPPVPVRSVVTSFTLQSSTSQISMPFTIGQAFRTETSRSRTRWSLPASWVSRR